LVGWSLLNLFVQTFKGGSVGGRACYTDPRCGEVGWVPTVFWIAGMLVILFVGFTVRSRRPGDRISIADMLAAVVVLVGVLVLAGVGLTIY
jgi:hypothetical protein